MEFDYLQTIEDVKIEATMSFKQIFALNRYLVNEISY